MKQKKKMIKFEPKYVNTRAVGSVPRKENTHASNTPWEHLPSVLFWLIAVSSIAYVCALYIAHRVPMPPTYHRCVHLLGCISAHDQRNPSTRRYTPLRLSLDIPYFKLVQALSGSRVGHATHSAYPASTHGVRHIFSFVSRVSLS